MDAGRRPEADSAHLRASLAEAELEVRQLREGMHNRTVIGQAQGILMEQLDVDAEHAFQYLKRLSSITNRKVSDLAAEIAETRRVPKV